MKHTLQVWSTDRLPRRHGSLPSCYLKYLYKLKHLTGWPGEEMEAISENCSPTHDSITWQQQLWIHVQRERERETYHHIPSQKQIASSHFYYPFCFMVMLKELFELLFITVFFLLLLLQWGSMEWIMLPVSSLRNMSCYSLGMISFNSKLLCLCFPLCAVMLYAWMLFAHHWSGRGASMIINCGGPIIINATRCHFVGFHL